MILKTLFAFVLVLSCCIKGAAFSSISTRPTQSMIFGKSTSNSLPEAKELLDLLIKKYNFQANTQDIDRIEVLMQSLQNLNVPINPEMTLDGPLYAVLHQAGPKPFWEKRSIDIAGKRNIKGQKYTKNRDGTFDIVNYAQLFGEVFSIQGCGVCVPSKEQLSDKKESHGGSFNILTNFVNGGEKRRCPIDYTVQIQNASVLLFGKQININVQGTGYMRILYSDENLRILTSPKDTSDSRWEERAGLTVAQVRIDLIDSKFNSEDL
jgi:hypothetical protein